VVDDEDIEYVAKFKGYDLNIWDDEDFIGVKQMKLRLLHESNS